jgi:hypothetical protein
MSNSSLPIIIADGDTLSEPNVIHRMKERYDAVINGQTKVRDWSYDLDGFRNLGKPKIIATEKRDDEKIA